MIRKFLNRFKKAEPAPAPKKQRSRMLFSTNDIAPNLIGEKLETIWETTFKNSVRPELQFALDEAKKTNSPSIAMDNNLSIKAPFLGNQIIPESQILWYAAQTFIGYQLCAMLSQNWLISKACLMPAEDAIRNGYEITINDGQKIDPKILDKIREYDVDYHLNANIIQFIQMGRIFGIRVAMFKVESNDEDYYKKPFNLDGVTPGSYKGISQIDPYWVTPQLDAQAAGDPSSIHFYEPTWWNIAGKLVHRTHLVIYRTEEVPDILKPSYVYGGIPIPQKIAERVYAAERIANEAPMLALTKRTDVINVDLSQALAEEVNFASRIQSWVFNRDNFGIKVLGENETMQQFDTSLTDLDAAIMTQYQLVAAIANVPAVKLLGTAPKGFNSTGEYEEANYHEALESLQTHAASPLLARHHLLLIRSEIMPKFSVAEFNVTATWKPLDAMTAEEMAELNKKKAETGQMLMASGAIDGQSERDRIIADPDSGYTGLNESAPDTEEPAEEISSKKDD